MKDIDIFAIESQYVKDSSISKDMNKRRFISLMLFFLQKTDEEHSVDINDIITHLESEGYNAEPKTIRKDIALLEDLGYDIITERSTPNRYYLGSRLFEVPELKLLIDAVSSSRFITEKKSSALIKKLKSLSSEYQSDSLSRHITNEKRIKPGNESIYYMLDTLNEAIRISKQIEFNYTIYNSKREKVLKNDGELYYLSPYTLLWNDDNYYLIGYSEKHGKVATFRADRMINVRITDIDQIAKPDGFDISDYSLKIFDMFDGAYYNVVLECDNEMMKYVVDRFGENIETHTKGESKFIASLNISVSPTFYSWLFQFGGKIKILSPKPVKDEFEQMLRRQLSE